MNTSLKNSEYEAQIIPVLCILILYQEIYFKRNEGVNTSKYVTALSHCHRVQSLAAVLPFSTVGMFKWVGSQRGIVC